MTINSPSTVAGQRPRREKEMIGLDGFSHNLPVCNQAARLGNKLD